VQPGVFRTLHVRVKRGGFGRSVVTTVVAAADAALGSGLIFVPKSI